MKIPQQPPQDAQAFAAFSSASQAAFSVMAALGYLHWDELRRRPLPAGLSHEAVWGALRASRLASKTSISLQSTDGEPFSFGLPAELSRLLHQTDVRGGFAIDAPDIVHPDQYYVSSLIEEAISSSQLEGAVTTTRVAEEMLRSGRQPRDKSERMVLNNYRAMRLIKSLVKEPLSPELVFQIHREVTADTLDDARSSGRLRQEDEEIVVGDNQGTVFHRPPHARELSRRLKIMCEFANEQRPDTFIHPVVRAMLLHFWLAYDHPFVDGNGRTARALFYWAALRHGYWMFEFISISRVLLRSPTDYYRAFLFSETDHNDATYFLLHQARVITEAVKDLRAWVSNKSKEARRVEERIKGFDGFNHRQQALLIHAVKHPKADLTIQRHQTDQAVVYQTARTDILELMRRKLLTRTKKGKQLVFRAAANLEQLLEG